jgi:ketosteroid isomerase-like protein
MGAADEMRALLEDIYRSFDSCDVAAWARDMAPDAVCIGSDEREWWETRDEMLPVLTTQLVEMKEAGVKVSHGNPVIRELGDVAWAADRPVVQLPDGTSSTFRLTVVAARRDDGKLCLQQMHLSVPAPNEEVLQVELTTG